ncbi:putative bifunctional diguanylate cyclase/phosphodiesterase [Vibrio maerlii]|uniref:putative bifunctional diguanylate cyclase/phosphodiesterase n=1 Tax=Vibrio maerlii TaxID=2231648 RepID=UPI000E3E5EE7|nr:bifunctional diguanylate cyclase/phosphodiesterase [Vibrio maerlii]
MPYQTIATILVSLGVVGQIASLLPAWRLHSQANNKGWHFLFGLIVLFVFAYIGCLYRIVLAEQVAGPGMGFGLILFAGSIFVYLAITMFSTSLTHLKSVADGYEYALSHDSLTELPNRSSMLKKLKSSITSGRASTLFILDIKHFKRVNESLGSQFGDRLLCHIAKLLNCKFGSIAEISRFGGNEFAISLIDHNEKQILLVRKELKRFMNSSISIDDYQINSGFAIASSCYPTLASDVDELLEQVSIALEKAKESSDEIISYNESLLDEGDKQPDMLEMVLQDIADDKLQVYYQPIIEAKTKNVVAVEALSRWPKRGGGFVPPNLFIPALEQANKVSSLTLWLISRIAKDLPVLREDNGVSSVHINLSAKDLMSQKVQLALEWHSINTPYFAKTVCLEITESAAFEQNETTEQTIQTLKQLGYGLSLDDFGTGYSSLSLLRKLPVEQVKLDRSFVSNIASNTSDYNIVKTMIELGHVLGYSVVAEGVETEEIANELESLGCDYQQGFLYSPAVPLAQLPTTYSGQVHVLRASA